MLFLHVLFGFLFFTFYIICFIGLVLDQVFSFGVEQTDCVSILISLHSFSCSLE